MPIVLQVWRRPKRSRAMNVCLCDAIGLESANCSDRHGHCPVLC